MMIKALILLFLCTAFTATATATHGGALSTPKTRAGPAQPLLSFKLNTTKPAQNQATCAFTVDIRTSCSSVRYTRDAISLAFGDAYGNQVYAPRIDDPRSRTFEQCSTDRFTIYGPCTYQICYVYLYRSGRDGWRPYDVTIYGPNSRPVSFFYDDYIPRDTWYGFNHCSRAVDKSAVKK